MKSALLFVSLLALGTAGCGAGTQRAGVSAAPPPSSTGASLLDAAPTAKEYAVDPSRSKLEVWGQDIMGGDHRITFGRWRARVTIDPVPTIAAELEMKTAIFDTHKATNILRYKLLEAHKYPHSTLEATLKKTGTRTGEHVVEGVADLHGIRKRLRFTGLLTQDGDTFRFKAEFVISRKTFALRYGPAEPFLKDDVRVVIDVLAAPAAVVAPPPPQPEPPDSDEEPAADPQPLQRGDAETPPPP